MIKAGQTILATDIIQTVVAGEALTAGNACYISASDGKAYKCDADDITKVAFVGFAQENASLDANVNLIHAIHVTGLSGLTIGAVYYLSGTAGAITATAPTIAVRVGVALSATVLKMDKNDLLVTKFGGTGADGDLAITSGTTTIDLAGAQVVTKNYNSISITGTGKLAFSNPHANGTIIYLKCKGNMTLTSSASPNIDATNCGASGGTGGTRSSSGGNTDGGEGTDGTSFTGLTTDGGHGTGVGTGHEAGNAGVYAYLTSVTSDYQMLERYRKLFVGAGGSGGRGTWTSGGSGTVVGGNGGRGGGALLIEVGGALNMTATNAVSVSGSTGLTGSTTGSPSTYCAGGGGGGAGGFLMLLYNTLVSVSGTVTATGGAGGPSVNAGGGTGRSGNGGSAISAGNGGSDGTTPAGGSGADGIALVMKNTAFF